MRPKAALDGGRRLGRIETRPGSGAVVERVRFTSGEAVVVRVVAFANMAVLVLAAALLATLVVRSGHDYSDARAVAAANRADLSDAQCRQVAPSSLSGYAALWDSLDPARWASATAAASVPLPDGRTVWLYGATTTRRGRTSAVTSWSSAVTQRGGCLHISHQGAPVLPSDDVWNVYRLDAAIPASPTSILVTATRLNVSADCDSCTVPEGTVAALVSVNTSGDLDFSSWVSLPDNGVSWGAALATDGQQIAVYGTQRDMSLVGYQVKVATVRVADFANRSKWYFWPAPVARGVAASTLNAWHDDSGWWVSQVPTSGSSATVPPMWHGNEAGGPYREMHLTLSGEAPDLRFSVGRSLTAPNNVLTQNPSNKAQYGG